MTGSDLLLSARFQVTSSDTDISGRLRLGALVNFLIQAAIQSADKLGFGFEYLNQQRLFWVFSGLHLEIDGPLSWYDEIEVETWPKNVYKFLYLRDFFRKDEHGKIIGKATSSWFAIDYDHHRPQKIEGDFSEMFHLLQDRVAIGSIPEKLVPLKEGISTDIKTNFFDIDLNKHVTSSRYVDWMMDLLPLDFHLNNYPKSLVINFMKETNIGERIRILKAPGDQNCFAFEGNNLDREAVAFRGRICF